MSGWRMVGVTLVLAGFFLLSGSTVAQKTASTPTGPVSPSDAVKLFELPTGLQVELVANEPQVVDPIAIRFDENGRMWVVEMRDYPHGPAKGQAPLSRVKVLEDRDNDGYYETSSTFADGLLFATGIQPWQDGVIVTMAGKVAYLKDTTGDGHADLKQVWFDGFAEDNPQLRANHPTLGIDGYVYVANGLRGGKVAGVHKKGPAVSISGMDFRFHPTSLTYEPITGVGQFGMTFDDWGNRFVCSNRNPLKHIVIENHYLARNKNAVVDATSHDVAVPGAASRIFPRTRAWTTSNLHAGQFTPACGVTIYRGSALPDFYGDAFICDPTGNLVHREKIGPQGATFSSRAAYADHDVLASRDEWCRPVNLENGPDGALYVVDMYRAVIEHPQWVPEELRDRPDERHGDDRGRIYRIVPRSWKRPVTEILTQLDEEALVGKLESRNAWTRETAARLLYEGSVSTPALTRVALKGRSPESRAQALWLLQSSPSLPNVIQQTLEQDPSPRVRQVAAVLADR